ncbi:WD repeat-containing protein 36 [Ooceraea biroi]|uniref:WD repeat-containing protein n=1 Tax=Ooceraea biroi TaxID=2015173 RepID=A0A026VX66_OOCBI|nr:WD repeat-containing protein 36 [Ooceraea biroi]EZA48352.1 WD repeat-containing protein [Ooceraea biroi]
MVQSRIFARNRALGYVSNHIPLVTRYILRRKEHFIVTCVGKEFHTYGCSHFTLLSVSGMHPDDITCLATDTFHVYTASANNIYAWRRGTELRHTYKGHDSTVHILLPFGAHLLSVDENSTLRVWNIKDESLLLELTFGNSIFKITTMMHPNTYMNKILLGSEQGQLQLWNVKQMRMIYAFKGWQSSVTTLVQAPAIDVAAVGLNDGRIILHNLKYDETLFELVQNWGPVISISFRTDGHPIMATGSVGGQIVFWNLEQRMVESQLCTAHNAAVTSLRYIPNEPLLVSSSPDNSLKLWIFDMSDGAGRLLRIREGHAEPPTIVRFYGNDGNYLLTTGGDSSLRLFSTVTEILNKSLGRASFNRKASKRKGLSVGDPMIMPPITELASEVTREKEWCNIAATHSGLGVVTTWSTHLQKMGDLKLLPERFKNNYNASATSLCLTKCGNFVVIGYNTGHVDRFNIQSGIHRASYGDESGAHEGAVKGIMVDDLIQTVITAGKDAKIKFWDFKNGRGMTTARTIITLEESVEWIRCHNESSLVAVALENFDIVLVDVDTRRIVRHFEGHEGRVTDACFNPDSRWLITASMDCTIRTWDIPSSHLIDIFQVPEACISLNFSATGEFLATAHVNNIGIFLWSNRTLYSHVSLKAISKDDVIPEVGLPGSSVEDKVDEDDIVAAEPDYVSPHQLDSDLVTMSTVAQSRWQNLLDIDIIKKRNKPKQAPKVSEAAPFFLPTIPTLQSLRFDLSDVADKTESSHIRSKSINPATFTTFTKFLKSTTTTDDFSDVIENLKTMGPSAIDFEIQSLSLSEDPELVLQFMKMLRHMMERQTDFELSQAYLAVFLKWHGTAISESKILRDYLREMQEVQTKNWLTLREKLFYNLSVVQSLKKM